MVTSSDEKFLRLAFRLAQQAREEGADPFGAALVFDNQVVHQAYDSSLAFSDPTYHAELRVISEYCRTNELVSLADYTLYASTEPCAMCAGAIHWARVSRLVFGISQAMLQQLSGGRPKLSAERIINSGHRRIEIMGPLLVEEELAVFQDYQFIPKSER